MNRKLKRSVVVGSAVAVMLSVGSPAALADDLTDILERARAATYTATRLTVSAWGDQTNLLRERVEHAQGAEMIRVDQTWSMVGNGRTVTMGDVPEGVAFMTVSPAVVTDRYRVGDVSECTHLRRKCTMVPILEGDLVRAQMLIDNRTGAPLITYVYDGTGRTFRTVSLSEFSPHRTYEWPPGTEDVPLEVVMQDDSSGVPQKLFGYELVDAFDGPASSEQGFYSDGLFSFSLFTMPSDTVVAGFEESLAMLTDRGAYDLLTSARDVRLHWEGRDRHYVLVGDLPPDHLEGVLDGLPDPGTGNLLSRIWRSLFG